MSIKKNAPYGGGAKMHDVANLRIADEQTLRIADRLMGDKKKHTDQMLGYEQPKKPKISLPEISIQKKQQSIEPLLTHKRDLKEQAIQTLTRNRPTLDEVLARLARCEFPGVIGYTYVSGTYCLTVRYVALSVQWYAHRDMCYVQEGNAKKRHFLLDIGTLIVKLEGGRRSFQ